VRVTVWKPPEVKVIGLGVLAADDGVNAIAVIAPVVDAVV
jgi:hypothetical protein